MSGAAAAMTVLPWEAIGASLVSLRVLQERKDSAIAEATIEGANGRRNVIVKQHRVVSRDGRSPQELARHEHAMLSALASLAPSVHGVTYGVPRPLLLDAGACIVVMEKAEGTPLDRLISAARRRASPRAVAGPLRSAAGWLRAMQSHTRRDSDGAALLDGAIARARATLDAAHDPKIAAQRGAIYKRMDQLRSSIEPRSLEVCGQHGDFWPGNVFISERRVEVIDFEGFRDGLPLQDIVYLLGYLEQLPLAIVDYRLLARPFLDAWRGDRPLDGAAFALLRLLHAIGSLPQGNVGGSALMKRLRRSPRDIVLQSVR